MTESQESIKSTSSSPRKRGRPPKHKRPVSESASPVPSNHPVPTNTSHDHGHDTTVSYLDAYPGLVDQDHIPIVFLPKMSNHDTKNMETDDTPTTEEQIVPEDSHVPTLPWKILPLPSLDHPPPKPSFHKVKPPFVHERAEPIAPYSRYLQPSEDDLAERVEYDMDEQDKYWLDILNEDRKRKHERECSMELFELIMDQLEKEWFDLIKDIPKPQREENLFPEDSTCAVCDDGEAENSNAIVFCDGCNIAVHQDCYGVPFIPEGQWLCRKCMLSPEKTVRCALCPLEGGAFKQTTNNKWVHLLCAMWVPECHVTNAVYMEPVEGLANIPKARYRLVCYICQKRHGAPIQCSFKTCVVAFHPSCGRKAKLYMKMRDVNHGGDHQQFRAYCDRHTPKEYRDIVDVDQTLAQAQDELSFISIPDSTSHPSSARRKSAPHLLEDHDHQAEPSKRMKKSRGRSTNIVFTSDEEDNDDVPTQTIGKSYSLTAPVIPVYIFKRVLETVNASPFASNKKKTELIVAIARYWALKREARRGAALLKRLHLEPWTVTSSASQEDEDNKAKRYQVLTYLRRDLERVRTLTEMVKKREKHKLAVSKTQMEYLVQYCYPLTKPLQDVLDQLIKLDKNGFFLHPVDPKEVPDYYDIIKSPMDFSTITEKLQSHTYTSVDAFEHDVELVCGNALLYNKMDTPFARLAVKLRKLSDTLLGPMKVQWNGLLDEKTGFLKGVEFDFEEVFSYDGLHLEEENK